MGLELIQMWKKNFFGSVLMRKMGVFRPKTFVPIQEREREK